MGLYEIEINGCWIFEMIIELNMLLICWVFVVRILKDFEEFWKNRI